jgi:hypothetical protein
MLMFLLFGHRDALGFLVLAVLRQMQLSSHYECLTWGKWAVLNIESDSKFFPSKNWCSGTIDSHVCGFRNPLRVLEWVLSPRVCWVKTFDRLTRSVTLLGASLWISGANRSYFGVFGGIFGIFPFFY